MMSMDIEHRACFDLCNEPSFAGIKSITFTDCKLIDNDVVRKELEEREKFLKALSDSSKRQCWFLQPNHGDDYWCVTHKCKANECLNKNNDNASN